MSFDLVVGQDLVEFDVSLGVLFLFLEEVELLGVEVVDDFHVGFVLVESAVDALEMGVEGLDDLDVVAAEVVEVMAVGTFEGDLVVLGLAVAIDHGN